MNNQPEKYLTEEAVFEWLDRPTYSVIGDRMYDYYKGCLKTEEDLLEQLTSSYLEYWNLDEEKHWATVNDLVCLYHEARGIGEMLLQ